METPLNKNLKNPFKHDKGRESHSGTGVLYTVSWGGRLLFF